MSIDIGLCVEGSGGKHCIRPASVLIRNAIDTEMCYGVCKSCSQYYSPVLQVSMADATAKQLGCAQREARRNAQKTYVGKLAMIAGDTETGHKMRTTQVFSSLHHCNETTIGTTEKGWAFLCEKYTPEEVDSGWIECFHAPDKDGNGFGRSWHPISHVVIMEQAE